MSVSGSVSMSRSMGKGGGRCWAIGSDSIGNSNHVVAYLQMRTRPWSLPPLSSSTLESLCASPVELIEKSYVLHW